ncbi:C39 family peptidase [Streptomyces actinomycinicus]|uniref:C39 family peptidase n=1 Tax=Streptomyces actinomycinicus TaxID=1695166 RepID=A0A937EFP6_9ACTN|nr:C39 family peptidase [Streptomyces actinomycinicus]MBL1081698.1 C39 family peptidase [Streptomyces actinomycinicus]
MTHGADHRTVSKGKRRRLALASALAAGLLTAGLATGPAFAAEDADDTDPAATEMATSSAISGALADETGSDSSEATPIAKVAAMAAYLASTPDDDADPDPAAAASLTYTTLGITTQMQQKPYWCGPAAGRAALTAFGVTKSQSTLASAMKTDRNGTYAHDIPIVLNHAQGRNPYVDNRITTSAKFLFGQVKTDVHKYKAPLIPLVQGHSLPLWSSNGYHGLHFITLYGYGSDGVSIKYFDPADADVLYGRHVVNRKYVYAAMNARYGSDGKATNELVW